MTERQPIPSDDSWQPVTFTFPDGRVVNRLGFGAMRLTGIDRARDIGLLRRAVELGVNHIDTARMYGDSRNEELVAAALSPFDQDILIASKGGIEVVEDGFRHDGRPEALRRHVEDSLGRLRVPRIGLYYLHDPDPNVPIAESVGALAQLRDEGKIALIGISNVTMSQLNEAMRTAPIAAVQNRYDASEDGDSTVVNATTQHGIAFVPWGPLRTVRLGHDDPANALRALLRLAPNVLPIPGTSSTAHLEENMRASS
jgi:pyridoxine 4-dehydrogenase